MKTKSLLSKTMLQFGLCTAAVFVLTAPLFYLLTKYFYAEDIVDVIEAVERGDGIPPLDLERDIIEGMMLQFILIFIVGSVSLVITIRFMTRRLWLPFDDTLQKSEQFNLAQDAIPQLMPTDISEFARLNRSIDSMMRKDKESYRIQKEFTENASHELQTPLAVVRSKLDLLMQEELTESQMRLVSDLYGLAIRMGHLNSNLLLLAKIENAQYTEMEDVDIIVMLSDSMPLYDALQGGASLHVDDRRSSGHATLRANAVLLECLLKNLIVNAIRHKPSESDVRIIVEDDGLTVSNKSADGTSLDEETIFHRFRTGCHKIDVQSSGSNQYSDSTQPKDNAQQRRNECQKGNGLGLAIVKAICDLHGWTVSYRFEAGSHHFTVHFQPAQL